MRVRVFVVSLSLTALVLCGWGFWGHRKVNYMAIFTLPPEMLGFFRRYAYFIEDHAVDADRRRYALPEEAPRHYLDLDRYTTKPDDTLLCAVEWVALEGGFWGLRCDTLALLPSNLPSSFQKGGTTVEAQVKFHTDRLTIAMWGIPALLVRIREKGELGWHLLPEAIELPRTWEEAIAKYGQDTLMEHGILPWTIVLWTKKLEEAFRQRNIHQILQYAADLGHYVADAHVPLHTTANYNGQLTGQHGIHALWESRLPELFGSGYDLTPQPAVYIHSPLDTAWKIILESHNRVDSVLTLERLATQICGEKYKFTFTQRGMGTVRSYSYRFCQIYDSLLNGMVARRMKKAIHRVGSYWYTAWVNAGKPNLDSLYISEATLKRISQRLEKQLERLHRTVKPTRSHEE